MNEKNILLYCIIRWRYHLKFEISQHVNTVQQNYRIGKFMSKFGITSNDHNIAKNHRILIFKKEFQSLKLLLSNAF